MEDNDLSPDTEDKLLKVLHRIIRFAVKLLAVLMTLVILWGVVDVVHVLYERLATPPLLILELSDILEVFGTFLAVLIGIEIFVNITLYLRKDVVHLKLVVATALMAVARKIIIFDYKQLDPSYIYSSGVLILALGVCYWLITRKEGSKGQVKVVGD